MRKIAKIVGLGAAAAIIGAVGWHAYAQTPMHSGSHGMGPGMMMGTHGGHGPMGGPSADPASRLASLKSELGITAQQLPAWDAYAKTVQDTATAMKAQRQGMDMTKMHAMSDQDRQAFMSQMRERHDKAFAPVKAAAETLLAALDDAQKTKAKEILPGLAAHGPGMMRHAAGGGPGTHGHHMPHGTAPDTK
jgi:hypothetical protein